MYSSGKLVAEYSTAIEPVETAKIAYTTTDHLGSPRIITDDTGTVRSRRDFMPFGEELHTGVGARTGDTGLKYSSDADNVRQKFTGYQKDTETSLDFAEARMYENRFGRFTAVDPLLASGKSANPQTFNRYTYTSNNPINRVDPEGLEWYLKKNGNGQPEWFDDNPGEDYEKAPHIYWAGDSFGFIALDYSSRHWEGYFATREDAVMFYDQPSDYSLFDGVNEMMDGFDIVTLGAGTIRLGARYALKKTIIEGGELFLERTTVKVLREGAERELRAAGKEVTKIAINGYVGRAAERLAKELLEKQGYEVLGSNVAVRVADGPTGLRFVDHLVRTQSGEIVAYEIKSGGGYRRLAQKAKDILLETAGGTIIGRNAPIDLKDKFLKIRTVELTIR